MQGIPIVGMYVGHAAAIHSPVCMINLLQYSRNFDTVWYWNTDKLELTFGQTEYQPTSQVAAVKLNIGLIERV